MMTHYCKQILGRLLLTLLLMQSCFAEQPADATDNVTIGSKAFTESVILGEMLRQLAEQAGARTEHKRQLGGTSILWRALLSGEIDAYPDYTGTLDGDTFSGIAGANENGTFTLTRDQ